MSEDSIALPSDEALKQLGMGDLERTRRQRRIISTRYWFIR